MLPADAVCGAVGVAEPLKTVAPVTEAVEVAEPDAGLVEEPEEAGAEVDEQTGWVSTVT